MKTSYLNRVVGSLILCTSAVSLADSMNVRTFTPSSSETWIYSEDALTNDQKGFGLGLTYDFEKNPLVRLNAEGTQRIANVVSELHSLDFLATYRIAPRWQVGIGIPLHSVTLDGQNPSTVLGDTRIFGKYRLSEEQAKTAFALLVETKIPTGDQASYVSDGSLGVGFRLIVEHDFKFLKLAANGGYFYSPGAMVVGQNLNYQHRLPYSLSANIPLSQKWALQAEGGGALPLPFNSIQHAGEGYLGAQYRPTDSLTTFLGAAVGKLDGPGSDDYRIVAGVRIRLTPEPAAPTEAAAEKIAETTTPPVVQTPSPVRKIQLLEQFRFRPGKWDISKHDQAILLALAKSIEDLVGDPNNQLEKIEIQGHTDDTLPTTGPSNDELSKNRASAIRKRLIQLLSRKTNQAKMDWKNLLIAAGKGSTLPLIGPSGKDGKFTSSDRKSNRRVEVVIKSQSH